MKLGYKFEYRRGDGEFDLFFTPAVGDRTHLILDQKEAKRLRDMLVRWIKDGAEV